MEMTVDCPNCGAALLVPEEAAGRRARCTHCDARFVIPSAQELLDQTVSHWMAESIDPVIEDEESDAVADATGATVGEAGAAASGGESAAAATDAGDDDASHGTVMGVAVGEDVGDIDDSERTVLRHDHFGEPAEPPTDRADADFDALMDADEAAYVTDMGADVGTPSPTETRIRPSSRAEGSYPTELNPSRPRPYLVVRSVSTDGVLLAFDAHWLQHEGFRVAMPMRCAFSGAAETGDLRCRPMVFHDMLIGPEQPVHTLEMRYESRLAGARSPRALMRGMGPLDGFRQPFNCPVLYYCAAQASSQSLKCAARSNGPGYICEVLVPSGATAIEWVERVNGRCGPEFSLLARDVANLDANPWRQLSERCRQRLEGWVQFQNREEFKLFLPDPDLPSRDEGLAGVVVTDQRLLYHKYRHNRSIALNQPATLHVRIDPHCVRLGIESHGRIAKLGKIQRHEVDRLCDSLRGASQLKLDVRQRDSL